MFALEANTQFLLFRSCSNRVKTRQLEPWLSKHPHMSNRIYETFDSEYVIFLNVQCLVGTQKNRLEETLVFVYSNTYFL